MVVALRVGQPVATMGFPGEIGFNTTVPITTFKDGTSSALRPFDPSSTQLTPANNKFVQHNLDLSPGTSGSPIFAHTGLIVAANNAGTEELVTNAPGDPSHIPSGNIDFGIRVAESMRSLSLTATETAYFQAKAFLVVRMMTAATL